MNDDTKYWVALHRIPGIGRVRFNLLRTHFESAEEAWAASRGDLAASGLDSKTVDAIAEGRPGVSPEREMERLQKLGVQVLTVDDPTYPSRLHEI